MGKKLFIILFLFISVGCALTNEDLVTKSALTACAYSAVFPGLGHAYIKNPIKAIPISITAGFLAISSATIIPAGDEVAYAHKKQFQQFLLALWLLSIVDVYAETSAYNAKIMNERDDLELDVVSAQW